LVRDTVALREAIARANTLDTASHERLKS